MTQNRRGQFAYGAAGPTEPPSLQARAQAFNAKDPRKFVANGVNQPIMLSPGNGNSAQDAARQTPNGQLPSKNGIASDTYSKLTPDYGMRLTI